MLQPAQVHKAERPGDAVNTIPAATEVIHMEQDDSWFRDCGPTVSLPSTLVPEYF